MLQWALAKIWIQSGTHQLSSMYPSACAEIHIYKNTELLRALSKEKQGKDIKQF